MARAVASISWLPAMWERAQLPRDRAAHSMARWATLLLGGSVTLPPRNSLPYVTSAIGSPHSAARSWSRVMG